MAFLNGQPLTDIEFNLEHDSLGHHKSGGTLFGGRLTLASGVPVPATDQFAKTTIYLTPYLGGISEISVAVPATISTPFDVFVYSNSGAYALETRDWTNTTTRAVALAYSSGILAKSTDSTRIYLGTGCTTGVSGQCEDSAGGASTPAKRLLANYYNRVQRSWRIWDFSGGWSYNSTWRMSNNSGNNSATFVVGLEEDIVDSYFQQGLLPGSGVYGYIGLGLDSTSVSSSVQSYAYQSPTFLTTFFKRLVVPGVHYLQCLEQSAGGSTTFYSTSGGNFAYMAFGGYMMG